MTPNAPQTVNAVPTDQPTEERLTNLERKVLMKLRRMMDHRKNCMIVIRVDGAGVQILDAAPSEYIAN
jgi:hypothetical protein